jgi:hypothetical protein
MGTEELSRVYPTNIRYYSYYSYLDEKKYLIVTDDYDEYITQSERKKMGGNKGIHLGYLNTEDGN